MNFKKVMNYLKPTKQPEVLSQPVQFRSFKAAFNNRFIDWIFSSNHKINIDLQTQLRILIERSRSLSQNNQLFRSFLINQQKTIIGSQGFRLQMQIKNADGTLNKELNTQIERAWKRFTSAKSLDVRGIYGDIDFDTLILRTLMIDGQVFIRIIKDKKAPFGIRFKLIDSLALDNTIFRNLTSTQNGIYNGVEVDQNYRPVKYWIRQCYDLNYESGQLISVPADQIIHLFKSQFVDQVRGFSPIVASLESLKQLDDYAVAELIAAKVASCQGIFYERNNDSPTGDFISQDKIDDGSFLTELSPGVASIVPRGYSVKTFASNHPNTDFPNFNKSLVKRVGAAMGSCYNKVNKDYSDVNYSSLKQANIDENDQIKLWQRFLIENWKNIQFELFLKNYLINEKTMLEPSEFYKYIDSYRFIARVEPAADPSKEVLAIERNLKLGLTSPIIEIEKRGQDYNEVLDDWVKWNQAIAVRGITFDYGNQSQAEEQNNISDKTNYTQQDEPKT